MNINLIIPCYNEADRIDLENFETGRKQLEKKGINLKYIFANDGSKDKTQEMLNLFCVKSGDVVYSAPQNMGKANVIYSAYQSHKNKDCDWIGFWDADLATPLIEVSKMLDFYKIYDNPSISSIFGSRVSRLGSSITRKMHRHYLGRIFITFVSVLLNVKAYDSQCGAKLFKPQTAELAFNEPFISRWIFDVEIMLRLNSSNIIEYPLTKWEDVPGSKVKVFREIFRVLNDLFKIRKRYLKK